MKKNIFKLFVLSALSVSLFTSCNNTQNERQLLKTINFDISLKEELNEDYTLYIVTEDNNYSLADNYITLSSSDNLSFKGTYTKEEGINYYDNKEETFEYKVIIDLKDSTLLKNDYMSSILSTNVTSEVLNVNIDNLNIELPPNKEEPVEPVTLKEISFNISFKDKIPSGYGVYLVSEDKEYSLTDFISLSSSDNKTYTGSYELEEGINYSLNDKDKFEFYLIVDKLNTKELKDDYKSDLLSISVNCESLTFNFENLEMDLPSESVDPDPDPDPTPDPDPDPTPEPDEKFTTVKFTINFITQIDTDWSIYVLNEESDYDINSFVELTSDDGLTFTGSYTNSNGIDYSKGDSSKFEFKFAIWEKGASTIEDKYISSIYSLSVSNKETQSFEISNFDMMRPGNMSSYIITSVYDADNNNENITSAEKNYIHFEDLDGNEISASDIEIGEEAKVVYSPATLMDGRVTIDHANIGYSSSSLEELNFVQREGSSSKTPIYEATFTKSDKDLLLNIYNGYEYLVGVNSNSTDYIKGLTINGEEYLTENLDEESEYIYVRANTEITINSNLSSTQVGNFVGYKINSSDSYSFDSGLFYGLLFDTYTFTLTRNDQLVTLVNLGTATETNLYLLDGVNPHAGPKVSSNSNIFVDPYHDYSLMFDGVYGKEGASNKGYDGWNVRQQYDDFGLQIETDIALPISRLEVYFWTGEEGAGMPKRMTAWIEDHEYTNFVQDENDENLWILELDAPITTTTVEIYACWNKKDESGGNVNDEWPNFSEVRAFSPNGEAIN